MSLIDKVERILSLTIETAENEGLTYPAAVRIHPDILLKISRIEGWFQHPLFYVQDSGVTGAGPNASHSSPVVNRVFVAGRTLPLIEDPHIYMISLDYGVSW